MSYTSYDAPPPKYEYWIPNWDINKSVITREIQFYLGPEATVRQYTHKGDDGYLITTSGQCLTDEQIDDICRKSAEVMEKQAAAKSKDKQLKRPLHQPIIVSRGSKFSSHRRHSDERDGGSRPRRHHGSDRGYGEGSRR